MTGDPAYVCHAGETVVIVDVEDVFDGDGCAEEVATGGVDDTLWFTSGSRGLKGDKLVS